MKKLLLSFLLFLSLLCNAQQSIIVGPQNDCGTKGISKNEHTSSQWFDVSGVEKLKITTRQHRTFDKSRIYNESGNLIWEWGGESLNDTWYEKVHIVAVKVNKIRVEFYQGYRDPYCNGFIKVEKVFHENNLIVNSQLIEGRTSTDKATENNNLSHTNAQDFSSFSPGPYKLTPFLQGELWGYKNDIGKIVIEPKFEIAAPFYLRTVYNPQTGESVSTSIKKLTVAKYKNEWVLINEEGKIKKKLGVDEVSLKYNRSSWVYRKNDKYGVINFDGKILSKPIYDFIIPTNKSDTKYGPNQHENIFNFIYQQNGKIGVSAILSISKEIYEYIPADYYKFYKFDMTPIDLNFNGNSCDLWGNELGDISLESTLFKKSKENMYHKFSFHSQSMFSYPIKLDSISHPSKVKMLMRENDTYGSKNRTPLQPSNNWVLINELIDIYKIKKSGKWGIVTSEALFGNNNTIYDNIIFDSISDFDEYSITIAYANGKCGLINHWSQPVIDLNYNTIIPLGLNYFAVEKNSLWGISYLDTLIFQPKYNDYKLKGKNLHLKKEDNWGVFTHDGKMLCDFNYNEIQDFEIFNGEVKFAKVIDNNKVGLINQNFEEVLTPQYDEILVIQYDNISKDLFVFVKEGGLYGSVNLDKSKINSIYNMSLIYNSIEELKNQIIIVQERIKEKRLEEERKLAEKKRIEEEIEEQRRVEEEKRQRKIQVESSLDDFSGISLFSIMAGRSNSSNSSTSSSGVNSNSNEIVYICTAGTQSECCKMVVVSSSKPKTSGCCSRTDGKGCINGHTWSKAGTSGGKRFACNYCGISVRTQSSPKNSCCPAKGCAVQHSWREIR